MNTDRQQGYHHIEVTLHADLPSTGQIQIWNPVTGERLAINGHLASKSATFEIDLPPTGSKLIVISKQACELPLYRRPATGRPIMNIGRDGWSYQLDDFNVLVLDRPDAEACSKDNPAFNRKQQEILRIDRELREYIGIPMRGGNCLQPWAKEISPDRPTLQLSLTYHINVQEVPVSPVYLALEQPNRWTIRMNNNSIDSGMASGGWVDPAIQLIPMDPSLFIRGENRLFLQGIFDETTDLEIVYLLGAFGGETDGKSVTMTKLPEKLKTGSWVEQGLPFYSGNVTYQTSFICEPRMRKTVLAQTTRI